MQKPKLETQSTMMTITMKKVKKVKEMMTMDLSLEMDQIEVAGTTMMEKETAMDRAVVIYVAESRVVKLLLALQAMLLDE